MRESLLKARDVNSKVLLYTFRTFPIDLLEDLTQKYDVFIISKIKDDLEKFKHLIEANNPKNVVGFALSRDSRQEQLAINKFNSGKIDASAPESRNMKVLTGAPFPLSSRETNSFCNYAMFSVSEVCEASFFHLKKSDFNTFVDFLRLFD